MRDLGFALREARPFVRRFVLVVAVGFATVGSAIGLLTTSAYLISRAAQHPSILELGIAIAGVRFFGIARGVFRYVERLLSHDLTFRVLGELRVRLFAALARLAPAGVEGFHSADLLNRLVGDVESLQHIYTRIAGPPLVAVAILILTAALGFALLPTTGLVVAAVLVAAMVVVPWMTGALGAAYGRRVGRQRTDYTAAVVALMQGAPDAVAFGRQGELLDEICALDDELTQSARSAAWLRGLGAAAITAFTGVALIAALAMGIPAVGDGRLAGENLAVLAMLALASFEAVAPLAQAFQHLGESVQATERLREILEIPAPIVEPEHPLPVPQQPTVELRDAWLRFGSGEWVLGGVDMRLEPGATVALLGPSGAGKTTVAEVLLRFRDLDEGVLHIGGLEATRFESDSVRERIGLAGESAHVFTGTVRDNLCLGNAEFTDEAMMAALRRSGLGHWVAGGAKGLNREVGERGSWISGGERRRLTLARALIPEFDVLILDEPTSGLDGETASRVMDEYMKAAKGTTTLLITHQVFGLADVDHIFVLDSGRIVQAGAHRELLRHEGIYRSMWEAHAVVTSCSGPAPG